MAYAPLKTENVSVFAKQDSIFTKEDAPLKVFKHITIYWRNLFCLLRIIEYMKTFIIIIVHRDKRIPIYFNY